jgi:signal transduction histidine kinase
MKSGAAAKSRRAGVTGAEIGRAPFPGPQLAARVLPFAIVALVAEASLALPAGPRSVPAVIVSLALLAATAAAFLLPWSRLPGWATVLVPLCYTGSALALILAAGTASGAGVVVLIPLVWTALFHRRWESACIVAAIVAAELIVSLVPQAAPDSAVVRRVLLWGSLGVLVSVATHGLRDRIRRSQQERAQLESRLRELTVLADRDRIARDLQDLVIKRLFAAGMSLQAAVSMAAKGDVARRIESAILDLDDAMRLIRQSIFGLRETSRGGGLRQGILDLCGELAPADGGAPEVMFSGPVDGAIPAGTGQQLLEMLREALVVIGEWARPARVGVTADDGVCLTVEGAGLVPRPDGSDGHGSDYARLRASASRLGANIDIEEVPGGTRFAWHLPIG